MILFLLKTANYLGQINIEHGGTTMENIQPPLSSSYLTSFHSKLAPFKKRKKTRLDLMFQLCPHPKAKKKQEAKEVRVDFLPICFAFDLWRMGRDGILSQDRLSKNDFAQSARFSAMNMQIDSPLIPAVTRFEPVDIGLPLPRLIIPSEPTRRDCESIFGRSLVVGL